MKEIGGYLGMEDYAGTEYHFDLIAVSSARAALLYILKAKKVQKLYLPHYLCDSVSRLCDKEKCPYELYPVDENFLPVFDKTLQNNEYLYVVNYYGQLSDKTVIGLKKAYNNVIIDNVQAFFRKPVFGVDTIYSCRKFFGVPDGGYVSTSAVINGNLPQDNSADRVRHILGRYEGPDATTYYADFKADDALLDDVGLRTMSKLTHNLLRAVDYQAVKKRREQNFALLHEGLKAKNSLKISAPDGPFAYPFYCHNGLEVRRKLGEQKIYVPTLWPNVLTSDDALARDYAENILPLPCDQRYREADMERVIQAVMQIASTARR